MVDDRNHKLAVISTALIDLGIHAAIGVAPLKLLQSAGDLGAGIRDFTQRTPAEERALLLLAPAAQDGALDADGQALFDRLEQRERKARVDRLLDDAERSLAKGQVSRARFAVSRALELAPGSERADALLDAIAASARDSAAPGRSARAEAPVVASWEVGIATALLTDADARAREARALRRPRRGARARDGALRAGRMRRSARRPCARSPTATTPPRQARAGSSRIAA